MQLTIRFLVLAILSGSATAKHRLGTYGLTNGGINICKEAGQRKINPFSLKKTSLES
ncbi:predicted protein [Plenodomus lingam JN3]|uniref:Predicted protein n=1 Tax=Leptosphaeria maculans (strain JN3 / isolate v23.1.3 / race Av1-4-5-6-7-8) TaxID=985895 RepID=E5AEJ8_LEPMJ|nr:predicted protein [Plenodomus lingam JN3]CBY01637.1 predicted protein [Plenodomus lingam JN3]